MSDDFYPRNLSNEEEIDFIIYGVPQKAIELVNWYRFNGYPQATIKIPYLEKLKKCSGNEGGEQYNVDYYIILGKGEICDKKRKISIVKDFKVD